MLCFIFMMHCNDHINCLACLILHIITLYKSYFRNKYPIYYNIRYLFLWEYLIYGFCFLLDCYSHTFHPRDTNIVGWTSLCSFSM